MNKKLFLEEMLEYIPSGTQTLSKNPGQFVIGVTPPVIDRAKGAYLWDKDGDKYLDLMLALGPMVFGYVNKRIDKKAKEQIDKGTIFSLPSEKELELAKLLKEVVPCAEMSRFVLNGNDATSGAIRLARHITKRDHIAKCGYHGWQDWSIGTKSGRNAGVPELVKTLTHEFTYNDPESLKKIFEKYPNQIAVVILEPASSEKPKNGFLKKIKEIAKNNGAILVFDEMVTGFRWALGGAQEYFGVIPDIACFGKAISNGYPLAAICGKAEYMKSMDEVFVSMTFGGFIPSLAAAIETINMMKELGNVHKYMHELGDYFIDKGNETFKKYELPIELAGYGPHPIMKVIITDDYINRLIKTFIYQEMNKAGILFSSSMMIGYIHKKEEIDFVLKNLDVICKKIKEKGDFKNLETLLEGRVIEPRTVRTYQ
ncbi:MAG: aminotransferase class III-fold pyridoxal phosphate-dependent enzyme [Patescibacteria group bacterium]